MTKTLSPPEHYRPAGRAVIQRLVDLLECGALILGKGQEIEFANEAAILLLGATGPEDLGERWSEVRAGLDAQLSESDLKLSDCPSFELELETDARHPYKLNLELFPIEDENSEGLIVLLRDRDITDALETALRLAARYRGLNTLFRATAHDLKAPFNAIMINLELLRESLAATVVEPAVHDKQSRYLGVLHGELARLQRSLHLILNQSMASNELQQTFDLRELLMDLIMLITPQAKQQHITVQYSLPEQSIWMLDSPDWLNQALLNIAINALEAMPGGGQLSIDVMAWSGRVEIVIGDTGSGIPQHIFENIWKMHFTTKRHGTGIGLYVSRNAIESHGGQIDVKTESDAGTKFILTLPTLN